MNEDLKQRERLSALADGELQGDEFAQAVGFAADGDGQSTWALYHLVGDVLRSPELACHGRPSLLDGVRAELAREPRPAPVTAVAAPVVRPEVKPAANGAAFRWKMVAGVASLAAVSAIGWNAAMGLRSDLSQGGQQLAAVPARVPAPVVAVAEGNAPQVQPGQQVMLRDPRLDELLAAHKQFGGTSALQMPAGFLRNATFESPSR